MKIKRVMLRLYFSLIVIFFSVSGVDRDKTHLVKHKIDTDKHTPIKQRPRQLPRATREVECREIDKC